MNNGQAQRRWVELDRFCGIIMRHLQKASIFPKSHNFGHNANKRDYDGKQEKTRLL